MSPFVLLIHAADFPASCRTAFLTVISHEIRTPIAGILGICELLMDDSTLSEGHRSLVGKAIRSGEILLDLVGMVLVREFVCLVFAVADPSALM